MGIFIYIIIGHSGESDMRRKIDFLVAVFALMIFIIPNNKAFAAEKIKSNQLVGIGVDTSVYESPDENSAAVGEFTNGMYVIIQEEPDNGWVKAKYQDIEGYIKLGAIKGQDSSELDQEFENISNDNLVIFENIELDESQRLQKIIWGVLIGGLVISLFVVGIIAGINSKKGNNEK
jgi:hypothetical protein